MNMRLSSVKLINALACLALLASACQGRVPDSVADELAGLTVNGTRVADGAAFLRSVENRSLWRNREGYRCYFSTFDDVELNPFVRCGPAPPSLKGEQGPWQTYRISSEAGPTDLQLKVVEDHGAGYRLLEGEALRRTDGTPPPRLDQITLPPVTGRVFETVWESLDYDFHYCMATAGVYAFDAVFTFDGREVRELRLDDLVEVVRLVDYDVASFEDQDAAPEPVAACVDEVARRAGASFGEVAE